MNGSEVLNGLREASLSAAVIILAVLLLRAMLQSRTPRRVFCLLWDVALARLLILTALPSPVSIRRWLPVSYSGQAAVMSYVVPPEVTAPASQIAAEGGTAVPDIVASQSVLLTDKGAVLTLAWLAVTLALAAWFLQSHLRSRRVYACSLPCGDGFALDWLAAHPMRRSVQVRTCDRISSPLTYGILRPVVLLPSGMDLTDGTALSYILEHEFQHIRCFDTLRKTLLACALCLHWFNPLVWVMYVLCNRDIELSCDEAVAECGVDRADYAKTLLDMEEQRGRRLSGSHFSQSILEERIKTIMKKKRFSLAALVVIAATMCIILTVFAAAAPDNREESSGADISDRRQQTVEGDVMILSKGGENGDKLYSVDGGNTWLSEERYHAEYGSWGDDWQVEWWTAEDYAVWLEEEKQALRDIIGERGYTGGDGWFIWDQDRVDETIALYESILEDIKNGALYSKTIVDKNGSVVEDVALGSGTLGVAEITTVDERDSVVPKTVDEDALLEELKPFGIEGEGSATLMTYNGQLVRHFVDGAPVGDDGYSIKYVYSNPDGVVDVHTLRSVIRYSDGSFDPMGELIGVAANGDPNFDQSLVESAVFSGGIEATTAEGVGDGKGTTFEELFAQYEPYGLVYSPREGGMGSLVLNGQAVKSFSDLKPDGGAFSYQDPYTDRGLKVYTQYDADGNLTGLRAE